AQAHEALAAGHDAQAVLVQAQALARAGDQAGLSRLLEGFNQRLEAAIAGGAGVLAGEDIVVQAEPDAPPVTIAGVDLRLQTAPGAVISVTIGARADDPALPQAAQR